MFVCSAFSFYFKTYTVHQIIKGMFSPNLIGKLFLWCNVNIYAGKYTPQWVWLRNEMKRVDRKLTPWLIVLMHAPLYNSNTAHYMEGEGMRAEFEPWFLKYKVDIVFAGHVHAYERSVSENHHFIFFLQVNPDAYALFMTY